MTSVNEIMKLAGRWRTANYAEREEARTDLQAAVETVAAVVAKKDAEIAVLGDNLIEMHDAKLKLQAEVERLRSCVRKAIDTTYSDSLQAEWIAALEQK